MLSERFPPETIVYSGHGPPTTLGAELERNPVPHPAARLVTTFEAPRGTHDILPSEQPLWRLVTTRPSASARSTATGRSRRRSSRTPRSSSAPSGEGSDVVHKEMYTFEDRGGRSLTLRPEATAPIARAYLEHGLHREAQPVKLYTVATMYRYAAPQRGRYREHWQLSVEAIGSDGPGDRRGGDPALRRAAGPAGRDEATSCC